MASRNRKRLFLPKIGPVEASLAGWRTLVWFRHNSGTYKPLPKLQVCSTGWAIQPQGFSGDQEMGFFLQRILPSAQIGTETSLHSIPKRAWGRGKGQCWHHTGWVSSSLSSLPAGAPKKCTVEHMYPRQLLSQWMQKNNLCCFCASLAYIYTKRSRHSTRRAFNHFGASCCRKATQVSCCSSRGIGGLGSHAIWA